MFGVAVVLVVKFLTHFVWLWMGMFLCLEIGGRGGFIECWSWVGEEQEVFGAPRYRWVEKCVNHSLWPDLGMLAAKWEFTLLTEIRVRL